MKFLTQAQVDAVRWKGDNAREVLDFVGRQNVAEGDTLLILGARGFLLVPVGHWIVSTNGTFSVVDPDTFARDFIPDA